MDEKDTADEGRCRLDKWLWAARFFKTRQLAQEAVNGGKVHLNGDRTRPAHAVAEGDEVRVRKGSYLFVVTVRGVRRTRGPAREAALLYEETAESIAARQRLAEQLKFSAITPTGRPDKRERRRVKRHTGEDF